MQKKTIRDLLNGLGDGTLNDKEKSLYKQASAMASQNVSLVTRHVIRNLHYCKFWRKETVSPVSKLMRGLPQSIWKRMKNNLVGLKTPEPTKQLINEKELTMHIDIKMNNKELEKLNTKALLKMELLSGAMLALGNLISKYSYSGEEELDSTIAGIGQLVSLLGDKHMDDWNHLLNDHIKLVKSD